MRPALHHNHHADTQPAAGGGRCSSQHAPAPCMRGGPATHTPPGRMLHAHAFECAMYCMHCCGRPCYRHAAVPAHFSRTWCDFETQLGACPPLPVTAPDTVHCAACVRERWTRRGAQFAHTHKLFQKAVAARHASHTRSGTRLHGSPATSGAVAWACTVVSQASGGVQRGAGGARAPATYRKRLR